MDKLQRYRVLVDVSDRHHALGDTPSADAEMDQMMTSGDESRKEVSTPRKSLAKPNQQLRVAAWNVRTLYETGKTAQVAKEMRRYRLDILGISEMRWLDSGITTLSSGETVCYSGRTDGHHME